MSTKRKKRRSRNGGGTLLGILVGLLVGLAIAVAAALYMTKSSVPFVDRVKRPPDRPLADPSKNGELPDPNRPLQKGKGGNGDPAPAAAVPMTPAPGAPPISAPNAAPNAAPAVGASPAAVAPPTAPAADPAPAADKSAYLLQAGAFKGQEDAESMKVKLALIGFEARIVTAEVNGVTFYRVRVGPYAQIEDMNRARSRLAENGIEASVVRQR
jgi:cell division protein FtsN